MTNQEIRKVAEIYQGGYRTLTLNILADIMERLEDLGSRIPKLIDKKYLEHK